MSKFILFFALIITIPIILGVGTIGFVASEIRTGSYEHLDKNKIIDILSKETVVYYSDGSTQLSSLFGSEHRQYVQLVELPPNLLNAVVAAEDSNFYHHFGVDLLGTLRAAYRNIVFQRREGASTITQQTVKNLYGRQQTNLKTKFIEIINAFKMEKKYSKKEILEFYLNQFHVTGNGRGAGIAAKYFFDKEISDITLIEAAFIAGSVKAPERYNPFNKRTIEAQLKAKDAAKNRKNYVLKRMLNCNFITQKEYDESINLEVPFKQGKFQFNELAITELVQRQLHKTEILKAINVESVDEVGSLGLRITTTINKNVQNASQYGVRQNLSRLEIILSGFQMEPDSNFISIQNPEKYGFYVGKISNIDLSPKNESLTISLGVSSCSVPTQGIERIAKLLAQPYYKNVDKTKLEFLKTLSINSYVMLSIKDIEPAGKIICDLERRPKIQGGLIVLDKGKIISMVGGFNPHEYNRAFFARRQPGSTFKTLTYYPALQLGWNILDTLANVRSVHQWQGQFYYPRPDHAPKIAETTFPGAGAKSENLASVWLLNHLLDKLTFEQFKDLLEFLEIHKEGESETSLLGKVANTFNVKLDEPNLRNGIFDKIKMDLANDLSISKNKSLSIVLKSMAYGRNFNSEIERLPKQKDLPVKERNIRINLLQNNFIHWLELYQKAITAVDTLKKHTESGLAITPEIKSVLANFKLTSDKHLAFNSQTPFLIEEISPVLENVKYQDISMDGILSQLDLDKTLLTEDSILLDGLIPLSLIKELNNTLDAQYQALGKPALEQLFVHDDFRYSVGMLYAQRLVKNMGIEGQVEWVPSFPLGTNIVSLAELGLVYQTILTGKTYRYFSSEHANQTVLIERIEDRQGALLWQAKPNSDELIDEIYSAPMFSILRGTVTNGTGYAAHNAVILSSKDRTLDAELLNAAIRVPSFGKTGTTNDYANATYVGFLPYPTEKGATELTRADAYTIAAYVGYDTNEPMKKGGFKVAGGTGALPAWIEVAKSLIQEQEFAEKLDWKKLAEKKVHEIPFDYGEGTKAVVPIYSSQVINAEIKSEENPEKTDIITFNDYADRAERNITISIPGKVENGMFFAKSIIKFFTPPKNPANLAISKDVTKDKSKTPEENDLPLEKTPQGLPSPISSSINKIDEPTIEEEKKDFAEEREADINEE